MYGQAGYRMDGYTRWTDRQNGWIDRLDGQTDRQTEWTVREN